MEKSKKVDEACSCGCRKRNNRCVSPNPCDECKKSNEAIKSRGRPKKVYLKEEDLNPAIETKVSKLLGFCNKCQLSITDWDREGEKKYNCPKCGVAGKISELKRELDIADRPKTKKEYFQSFNSAYTWHNYSTSSNINTIAKPMPLTDDLDSEISADKTHEDTFLDKHVDD